MIVIKRIPVLIIAVVLVIGVVYGAVIWIFNSRVPVEYSNPITIEMSDEIQIEEEDQWTPVNIRDTTERGGANFSYSDPPYQFYTYVNISNVEGNVDRTVETEVQKPDDFDAGQMGFTIRSGIVDPGAIDEVDQWDSITNQTTVKQGEKNLLTVVYTLSDDAPSQPQEPVIWNFSEI